MSEMIEIIDGLPESAVAVRDEIRAESTTTSSITKYGPEAGGKLVGMVEKKTYETPVVENRLYHVFPQYDTSGKYPETTGSKEYIEETV